MKKIFKRIAIAFSLYSRIPMPRFVWDEEDTCHAVAFLPSIGIVIGLIEYGAYCLALHFNLPETAAAAFYTLIPLVITGGFHIDGFMDTEDALQSYKGKDEKLKILKDSHIGAFSVIRLIILGLFWMSGLSLIMNAGREAFEVFCLMFVEIRCLTGLLGILMPHARTDGMLNMETGGKNGSRNRADIVLLLMGALAGLVLIGLTDWRYLIVFAITELLYVLFYVKKMMREFGGVTGDTIGFFLVCAETLGAVLLGIGAFNIK